MVHNINLIGIKGKFSSFGILKPNPGQTDISNILFKDFDVTLTQDKLATSGVKDLKFENVIVNGAAAVGSPPKQLLLSPDKAKARRECRAFACCCCLAV